MTADEIKEEGRVDMLDPPISKDFSLRGDCFIISDSIAVSCIGVRLDENKVTVLRLQTNFASIVASILRREDTHERLISSRVL